MGDPRAQVVMDEEEINLLAYLSALWRFKWLLLVLCLAAVGSAYYYSTTARKIYRSTVTLVTPRDSGIGGGLLSALQGTGLGIQLPLPSANPSREILVSVLRSRTVAAEVVERFGLQQRYGLPHREDAITGLQGRSEVLVSREGVISVAVEDWEPALAAVLANATAESAGRLLGRLGAGSAGRERVFFTEQMAKAKKELEAAEDALRRFQERNRAIVLQEQTRGQIDSAARLAGEIMAAQVQLQVMRNFATESNPEVVSLVRKIEEMRRQLARMQYGDGTESRGRGRDRGEMYVPFARVPEVGLDLARLTRTVKTQETLVTLLTQQVEQAKLAERREWPTFEVLDRAVPAVRHIRPSVRLNVALAGMAALFVGVTLAFALDYLGGLGRRRPAPARPGGNP